MKREVALCFYGPSKVEGDRETIQHTLKTLLINFMSEKGISDYKLERIEYEGRKPTSIIGTYLYGGYAVIEVKEGDFYESEPYGAKESSSSS